MNIIEKLNVKNIYRFVKSHYLIIAILFFGFIIRWCGIYFDYPRVDFIWDEIYNVAYLFDIFEQKTLIVNPSSSTYPIVLPILLMPMLVLRLIYIALINGIHTVTALKNHLLEFGIGEVYIIARWYSVVFGTATILFLYKIYKKIYKDKLCSYYAAIVYAVSLLPVYISHWGKHHSAMVFFYILSLFLILKFEEGKKIKFFYWSVVFSALTFSTHYIGISALILPAYGFFINRDRFNFKILLKSSCLFLFLSLFMYLFNYHGIIGMINNAMPYYKETNFTGIYQVGFFERFYYLFRDYFMVDPVFMSLFIIMVIISWKKFISNKYIQYILTGLAFNYLLMITIITGPKSVRWFLIFVSLIIPLAAASFIDFLIKKNIKRKFVYSIAIVLIIPSIIISGLWLNLINSNTRIEASDWLIKNVPKEKIYSFIHPLNDQYSYNAAVWNKNNNENMSFRKIEYIISNKDYFENRGIFILYDRDHKRYKDLGGTDTKYVVVGYSKLAESDEIVSNLKKFHKIELVKSFYPTKNEKYLKNGIDYDILNNPADWRSLFYLEKSGGFLDIYKVDYGQ